MIHIPADAGSVLVCLDGYEQRDLAGTLISPYVASPADFHNTSELIYQMESLFNSIGYPQPFFACRTFARARALPALKPVFNRYFSDADLERRRGKAATFSVRVQSRQNVSWQGEAVWLEQGRRKGFRSALALIFLLDGALVQLGGRGREGREAWTREI